MHTHTHTHDFRVHTITRSSFEDRKRVKGDYIVISEFVTLTLRLWGANLRRVGGGGCYVTTPQKQ